MIIPEFDDAVDACATGPVGAATAFIYHFQPPPGVDPEGAAEFRRLLQAVLDDHARATAQEIADGVATALKTPTTENVHART